MVISTRQYFVFQLITQNQERFIEMLNNPSEGGEQEGGAPPVGGHQEDGAIQVTPEEKQAIERVSHNFICNT